MSTGDTTPSPDRCVIVAIRPETTDEELDELADALYEQMSGWPKSDMTGEGFDSY
jgi:hypothetical protein